MTFLHLKKSKRFLQCFMLKSSYITTGLCNHLLCYAVSRTRMFEVVPSSSILDKSTFFAHTFLGDGQLYIAMHSDVVL